MAESPSDLLARIRALQVQKPEGCYEVGMFRSQRVHRHLPMRREDHNIFFSSQLVFILNGLTPHLPAADKELVALIGREVRANYPGYARPTVPRTYNFWPRQPGAHFPNGRVLHRFRKFALPDDVDVTALIYLTEPHPAREQQQLKDQLPRHANNTRLRVQTSRPAYADLNAYSTWLGRHMPIELDVCVLCNLLYFIYEAQLPLNQHDADTLTFVRNVVANRDYFTEPFRVAPSYPSAAIQLYHIVRLAARFDIPELRPYRNQLVADCRRAFAEAHDSMERVILSTSLRRLGERQAAVAQETDIGQFSWFTAAMLSVYGHPLLKRLAPSSWAQFKYRCEAFNLALVFENQVLMAAAGI